ARAAADEQGGKARDTPRFPRLQDKPIEPVVTQDVFAIRREPPPAPDLDQALEFLCRRYVGPESLVPPAPCRDPADKGEEDRLDGQKVGAEDEDQRPDADHASPHAETEAITRHCGIPGWNTSGGSSAPLSSRAPTNVGRRPVA